LTPQNAWNFLTWFETISILRGTMLHLVSFNTYG